MKSFLLLILTLITGCRVSSDESEVKGCRGGWVDFNCSYPKANRGYGAVYLTWGQNYRIDTLKDKWKNHSRFSLYHNTKGKSLRVVIRDLQDEDQRKYKCRFDRDKREVELEFGGDVCQRPVEETAYRGAETPITCRYPEKYRSYEKFFCKEHYPLCEDISSSRLFTIKQTDRQLNVSINQVSSQHQGIYWCGLKSDRKSFRAGVRKITINDIPTSTFSVSVRDKFTQQCEYPNGAPIKKFICKGDDPFSCQLLFSATQGIKSKERFSMEVASSKSRITFMVREVAVEDSGTYWCGAERDGGPHRNPLYQRFRMVVVPAAMSTSTSESTSKSTSAFTTKSTSTSMFTSVPKSTSTSTSFTWTTAASNQNAGGAQLAVIIPAVCAAALVLLLLSVLAYKRTKRSTNGETHEQKEERASEEIQERPQKPASGTALKTIYTTATFPTIPSAPNEYESITFMNPSVDTNNDTYSTVRESKQCPAPSAVNHPSGLSADPFYSTLCNPWQQQQQQ